MTIPRAVADRLGIVPGDDLEWRVEGDAVVVHRTTRPELTLDERRAVFDEMVRRCGFVAGRATSCTRVAALVDSNVLVYCFDDRFPLKRQIARRLMRAGGQAGRRARPPQAPVAIS